MRKFRQVSSEHINKLNFAQKENSESDFTILTETPNLYFQLFTPDKPGHMTGGTYPPFPEGNLSFLYEIPSIGTKFKAVESMGPSSLKINCLSKREFMARCIPLELRFFAICETQNAKNFIDSHVNWDRDSPRYMKKVLLRSAITRVTCYGGLFFITFGCKKIKTYADFSFFKTLRDTK